MGKAELSLQETNTKYPNTILKSYLAHTNKNKQLNILSHLASLHCTYSDTSINIWVYIDDRFISKQILFDKISYITQKLPTPLKYDVKLYIHPSLEKKMMSYARYLQIHLQLRGIHVQIVPTPKTIREYEETFWHIIKTRDLITCDGFYSKCIKTIQLGLYG
jgi:hypothetical protein